MAVAPVTVDGLPTLTLAAGSAGGVAVALSIDPVNDYLAVYTASATATQGINRNTLLGLSSAPLGLTDTQTSTNKTFTSPTLTTPTITGTVAGTFTLPSTTTFPAPVTTLTGTQTLTNKTLTSPVINAPTITNATYTGDAIVGFTTSNNGVVYGLTVTGGNISGANLTAATVGSTALATNAVQASQISTGAVYLGSILNSTDVTTTSGALVLITGMTLTITVPAGGRKVKISMLFGAPYTTSTGQALGFSVWRGTVGTGTQVTPTSNFYYSASSGAAIITFGIDSPSAGSVTYNGAWSVSGGTAHTNGATNGGILLAEYI